MALALITAVRDGPSGPVLEVDLGSNRYVRYMIGTGARRETDGDVLEGVSYESPVRSRSGTGAFQTRLDLELDASRLDREHQHVQVVTFREADGRGPAWSGVVAVAKAIEAIPEFRRPDVNQESLAAAAATTRSVPMTLRDSPMSAAMDWGSLLGLVDELAPLAKKLFGLADAPQVQQGASKVIDVVAPLLRELLSALMGSSSPTPGAVTPGRRAGAATLMSGQASLSRGLFIDGGVITGPMLAGLISAVAPEAMKALGPLLQSAPQVVQGFLDHPIKLINAIGERERIEQELLNSRINSMLQQGNQALLFTLLNGMGQLPGGSANAAIGVSTTASLRRAAGDRRLRTPARSARTASRLAFAANGQPNVRDDRSIDSRVEAVLIPPDPIPGVTGSTTWYATGQPIGLVLTLRTPHAPPTRPMPHVVAHVRVCDAATGRLALERRIELSSVYLNQPVGVTLDAGAVTTLPTGRDLIASVDVTWTSTNGHGFTTPARALQNLYMAGPVFVSEPGQRGGDEISLSDPVHHRAFWHRIWEGGSASHSRWELNVATRYYYTLATEQTSNARMETKLRFADDRTKEAESKVEWGGFLKSGMELAPDVLNLLLTDLGQPQWTGEELAALRSDVVARSVTTKAELDVHLRGRAEERGALWVFPVLSQVEFTLHRPANVDAHGAIRSTTSEIKQFPLPVSAVFVGMESEG